MTKTKYLGEQILFHATNVDAANSIMSSKQFHPGKAGLFGAGIYFADSIYYCFRKSANGVDAVIMCRVDAGTALVIEGSYPNMGINYLKTINCQSVQGRYKPTSGWEYIVYEQHRVTPLNAIMPPTFSQFQNKSLAQTHKLTNNGNVIFHFNVVPNLPFQIILNLTAFTKIKGPSLTNNPLLSAANNFSSHIFTDSTTLNNYTASNIFSKIANSKFLKLNHLTHKMLLQNPLFQSSFSQLSKDLDFKYSTKIAGLIMKALSKKIKSAFLLALIGGINGCLIAEYLTNTKEILQTRANKISAGLLGPIPIGGWINGVGGVEFRTIKKMLEFTNEVLVVARSNNIFFESKFEKEIRDAFSLICLDQYQNMPLSYYFETIVREIQIGFLGEESIPFISLHFNKQAHLYSVMSNYYQNTIIGNVITFLDYFLKGFVNGGYFMIPFVRNWEKNPVDDLEELNRNLVDVHDIAKEKDLDYASIYDLINADETIDKFSSAFRIIGELNEKIFLNEKTFIPTADFSVETDVNKTAEFANSILQNSPNVKGEWGAIVSAHHVMKDIIHRTMPKIEYFKGFFEILKMITFALHYVASFHEIGQFIKTPNALQNKSRGPYVHPIPTIFPPLPVRHITKINFEIKVEEIVDLLNSTQIDSVFRILAETSQDDASNQEYQKIMDSLTSFYRKKIEDGLPKPIIHFPDDNVIKLKDFKDTVINSIKLLYQIKTNMNQIFDNLYDEFIKKFPSTFPNLQNHVNTQKDDLSYNAYSDLSNQFDQYRKLIKPKFDEMAMECISNSQSTNNEDLKDENNVTNNGPNSQSNNTNFEDTQAYQILSQNIANIDQSIQNISDGLSHNADIIKQIDSLGANNTPNNYEIKKQCEQKNAIFEIIKADLSNENQMYKDKLAADKNHFDSIKNLDGLLDDNRETQEIKQSLLYSKNSHDIINKSLQNKTDIIQKINALPIDIQQNSQCSSFKGQCEQEKVIYEIQLMHLNNSIQTFQTQLDENLKYSDNIQKIEKTQQKATKKYILLDDKEITQAYNLKKQMVNENISHCQKNIDIAKKSIQEEIQIIQKLNLVQAEIQQNPKYMNLKYQCEQEKNRLDNLLINLTNNIQINKQKLNECDKEYADIKQSIKRNKDGYDELIKSFKEGLKSLNNSRKECDKNYKLFYQSKLELDEVNIKEHRIMELKNNNVRIHGGCLVKTHKDIELVPITFSKPKEGIKLELDTCPIYVDGLIMTTLFTKSVIPDSANQNNVMNFSQTETSIITNRIIDADSIKLNEITPKVEIEACSSNNLLTVNQLVMNDVDMSGESSNGTFPLLAAIENGYREVALLLLMSSGKIGDVNRSSETGWTPLHWAVYHGFDDVVLLLLSRGASVSCRTKVDQMTPIHIACFYNRTKCLQIMLKENNGILSQMDIDFSPIHISVLGSSPLCSLLLIDSNANCKFINPHNYDVKTYAIYNGQFELAKLINDPLKLKLDPPQNEKVEKNVEVNFNNLCIAFQSGLFDKATKMFYDYIEKNQLNQKQEMQLIDSACRDGNVGFIQLLAQIIRFEDYPIVLTVAEYGLSNWLQPIVKCGADLNFEKDGKTIFDIAVFNDDTVFIEEAFNLIDDVNEKTICRIIRQSIKNESIEMQKCIAKQLSKNSKLNSKRISIDDLFMFETTNDSYLLFRDKLNVDHLTISDLVLKISPKLIPFILGILNPTEEEVLNALNISIDKCSRNAVSIFKNYPINFDKLKNLDDHITEFLEIINKDSISEEKLKESLSKIDISYEINLLDKAAAQKNGIQILSSISDELLKQFKITSPNFRIWKNQLQLLLSLFEKRFKDEAGHHFLNVFSDLDFDDLELMGYGNQFICKLIEAISPKYFKSKNKKGQNFLHLIAKIVGINDKTVDVIIDLLTENEKELKDMINDSNNKGETLYLLFATSHQFKLMNKIVKIGARQTDKDINQNNALQRIIDSPIAKNMDIFDDVLELVHQYPEMILQRNRKGENAFHIAVRHGFNGIIGIMSNVYPVCLLDELSEKLDSTALHIACIWNQPTTIRYLIESLHIDPNIRNSKGQTPLHIAAVQSSSESFSELISHGANPLLVDSYDQNPVHYGVELGCSNIHDQIMKMALFDLISSSASILISSVINTESYELFKKILFAYDPGDLDVCDQNGYGIISSCCIHNNQKALSDLLSFGCDPFKKSFNEKNAIHQCAIHDSIGCSQMILQNVNASIGQNGVLKLLQEQDNEGNTPLHLAIENNRIGFVTHLLSVSIHASIDIMNKSGHTPVTLAIKKGNKLMASILVIISFFTSDSLKKFEKTIQDEMSPKLESLLNSDEFKEANKTVNKIISSSWILNSNPQTTQEEPKKTRLDLFIDDLKENGIIINTDSIFKHESILKCTSIHNKAKSLLYLTEIQDGKRILESILKAIDETPNDQVNNKFAELFFCGIIPKISTEDDINKSIQLFKSLTTIKVENSHPFYAWIENGLVSVAENSNEQDIVENFEYLVQFLTEINKNQSLLEVIQYPLLIAPVHQIGKALSKLKLNEKRIQLKWIKYLPITSLNKPIEKVSVVIRNKQSDDSESLINYIRKDSKLDINYLDRAISASIEVYDDILINDNDKKIILNSLCKVLEFCSNKFESIQMNKWSHYSVTIVSNYGIKFYQNLIDILKKKKLDEILSYLFLIVQILPEKVTINDVKNGLKCIQGIANKIKSLQHSNEKSLKDIIQSFHSKPGDFIPYKSSFDGTPNFPLSDPEIKDLENIGDILFGSKEEETMINFKVDGLTLGKKFLNDPNLQNAASLISFVSKAIKKTFDITPYKIQCLIVSALLLHRIHKQQKSYQFDFKGRIAQVATGEGKSIIIAMLAACLGLTGYFVDVITSSSYLSQRDAEKFAPFYELIGLSVGSFKDNDHDPNFNKHILYSTNTGFEFQILREGISGKQKLMAVPFGQKEKVYRKRMSVIVDEADNLFIDTSQNSARISHKAKKDFSWVYQPIFEQIQKNVPSNILNQLKEKQLSIMDLLPSIMHQLNVRDVLKKVASGRYSSEIDLITEKKIVKWVISALRAMIYERGKEYKVTNGNKVEIADFKNTGRIMVGSEWSNGLHQFIEVKEGIAPKAESAVIASISHPSFFKDYEEIYGLTGTLGEGVERDEIMKVYKVDSFDAPSNRKCLRTREKTLITKLSESNEKVSEKHKQIIKVIKEMIKAKRATLVIVETINESEKLSEILHSENIQHFLLNDCQKEDEEFIVSRAGKPSAVTIATNTAGRGTDIKIDRVVENKGGLHVILGFFPVNLRVECQGLGRSGRQGQKGTCQIILESNEYATDTVEATEETLKQMYNKRSSEVRELSNYRNMVFKIEIERYKVLQKFFSYIRYLSNFIETPEAVEIIHSELKCADSENFARIVINDLQLEWADFYTRLEDDNGETAYLCSFEFFLRNNWKLNEMYPQLGAGFDKYLDDNKLADEFKDAIPTESSENKKESMNQTTNETNSSTNSPEQNQPTNDANKSTKSPPSQQNTEQATNDSSKDSTTSPEQNQQIPQNQPTNDVNKSTTTPPPNQPNAEQTSNDSSNDSINSPEQNQPASDANDSTKTPPPNQLNTEQAANDSSNDSINSPEQNQPASDANDSTTTHSPNQQAQEQSTKDSNNISTDSSGQNQQSQNQPTFTSNDSSTTPSPNQQTQQKSTNDSNNISTDSSGQNQPADDYTTIPPSTNQQNTEQATNDTGKDSTNSPDQNQQSQNQPTNDANNSTATPPPNQPNTEQPTKTADPLNQNQQTSANEATNATAASSSPKQQETSTESDSNQNQQNPKQPQSGTSLFQAIEDQDIDLVRSLISQSDVDINSQKQEQNDQITIEKTALHIAIEKENLEIISLLLSHAQLNINSTYTKIINSKTYEVIQTKNALNLAIEKQNIDIVRLLLSKGIDYNFISTTNQKRGNRTNLIKQETALTMACQIEKTEIAELLLKQPNININFKEIEDETRNTQKATKTIKAPIHLAVEKGDISLVSAILEINGVDVLSIAEFLNQKNPLQIISKQKTALDISDENKTFEISKLLRKKGCKKAILLR